LDHEITFAFILIKLNASELILENKNFYSYLYSRKGEITKNGGEPKFIEHFRYFSHVEPRLGW